MSKQFSLIKQEAIASDTVLILAKTMKSVTWRCNRTKETHTAEGSSKALGLTLVYIDNSWFSRILNIQSARSFLSYIVICWAVGVHGSALLNRIAAHENPVKYVTTVSFHLQQRPPQECQLPLDRSSVPVIRERQHGCIGVIVVFLQLSLPW